MMINFNYNLLIDFILARFAQQKDKVRHTNNRRDNTTGKFKGGK
ncbi:hypothetical protein GM3708_2550 [Geminocystis sp. NIES-3708]|nr:hypothetical protein GM3708_2550 [Geminocystis sp. NIES-3708]